MSDTVVAPSLNHLCNGDSYQNRSLTRKCLHRSDSASGTTSAMTGFKNARKTFVKHLHKCLLQRLKPKSASAVVVREWKLARYCGSKQRSAAAIASRKRRRVRRNGSKLGNHLLLRIQKPLSPLVKRMNLWNLYDGQKIQRMKIKIKQSNEKN